MSRDGDVSARGESARGGFGRRAIIGGLSAFAVLASAFWITRPTKSIAPREPGAVGADVASVSRCTSNAACMQENGGKPAVCRKGDGACVSLTTPSCTLLAEPGDVENDATIWLGAMFPTTGPSAAQFGHESVNAADLARRDFMTIARGIPYRADAERAARPLALVVCDDAENPVESARHLAEKVRVPAIVGFNASQEVIDLAGSTFLPNGVVAMATQNQSPLIATIPTPRAPRAWFGGRP